MQKQSKAKGVFTVFYRQSNHGASSVMRLAKVHTLESAIASAEQNLELSTLPDGSYYLVDSVDVYNVLFNFTKGS